MLVAVSYLFNFQRDKYAGLKRPQGPQQIHRRLLIGAALIFLWLALLPSFFIRPLVEPGRCLGGQGDQQILLGAQQLQAFDLASSDSLCG